MTSTPNDLSQEIIRTQQALSYVRRPQLSVKLLSKPPFKFIHDLATEIMKTLQDIPRNLFSEKELDRNAFEKKEEKMAYLDKLINWSSYLIGTRVDVSVKSILMGKEPEKTNRFLQAIGGATKIAEGEPERGQEAADHANGRGTRAGASGNDRSQSGERGNNREKERETSKSPGQRRRQQSGGAFDNDDDESAGPRIIEDKNRDDDGADAFQVVDVSEGKIRTTQMNQRSKLKDAKNVDEFEEHGVLVRKILEMKRGIEEMERQGQRDDDDAMAAERPPSSTTLDQQQKDRDAIRFRREIADLRRKIQTLASCVTPMGREMDEVQIAVDLMLQEHAKWRDENAFLRERLIQERTASAVSLAPLTTKLRILQADIDDKVEHIRSQKRTIKFNDDRISRILLKGLQMGKESN